MVASIESGASGLTVRASVWTLPGPWHCSHPMPSASAAYLPSANGTAGLVPLWHAMQRSGMRRSKRPLDSA